MSTSTTTIQTGNGSRYLQQLCKHWTHRFSVTFDPDRGTIDFGDGKVVSLSADAQTLTASISSEDDLDRLEQVVQDHIARFAFRETLSFRWVRQA